MKLSVVFALAGVLAILFGLSFLFAPAQTLALYGFESTTPGWRYAAQSFGGALLGVGVMNWLARNAADSDARRAIVTGNVVSNVAGLVLAVIMQLQGVVNAFGWTSVVIFLVLSVGFARHAFGRDVRAAHAT
jgi:hypothetical protein